MDLFTLSQPQSQRLVRDVTNELLRFRNVYDNANPKQIGDNVAAILNPPWHQSLAAPPPIPTVAAAWFDSCPEPARTVPHVPHASHAYRIESLIGTPVTFDKDVACQKNRMGAVAATLMHFMSHLLWDIRNQAYSVPPDAPLLTTDLFVFVKPVAFLVTLCPWTYLLVPNREAVTPCPTTPCPSA